MVSIIGLLAGTVFPTYYEWFREQRLMLAARQVQADFLWARDQAVAQRASYTLIFRRNTANYSVLRVNQTLRQTVLENGIKIAQTTFNAGTLWQDRFIFTEDGRARLPGMGGTVTLTDGRGRSRYVVISRSGRVRIDRQAPRSDQEL
ncbi:Tfp pilus assembly protein FimT [Heliophilum fasciatum]|nr:Tfp pilus assembly protein FimT [Heliophilum fasciatum]